MKLKLNIFILAVLLSCIMMGCSKKSADPGMPTTTTTGTTYTDPAQFGTPYSGVPASKDIVMYEVNLRTLTPANFVGLEARLDSIKALGVNVVWLMPTYPIGALKSVGSPYCVKDPKGVNSDFGTLSDLQTVVSMAHTKGMAVIMDWIANDTSWDNVWIANKAWYLQDASGNIIAPPGTTYTDVAALNFNNNDMRLAMINAMKYWIFAANIDGYRCDFADNVTTNFWTQALDTLSNIKTHKLIYLAEGTTGAEISSGFQLGYAFSFYSTLKGLFAGSQTPSSLFNSSASEIAAIPSTGLKLRYITNHDDASSDGSTITEYKSKQGALAAFVLATYIGGVPLIYDSQEVGYAGSINFFNNVPVNYAANPDMVAAYKKILAFRAAHEAVKTGTIANYPDTDIAAFEKKSGTDDVVILVNIRNSVINYAVPPGLQNTTWTDGLAGGAVTLGTQYTLQPYSYLVLRK
jgi:glycosidase